MAYLSIATAPRVPWLPFALAIWVGAAVTAAASGLFLALPLPAFGMTVGVLVLTACAAWFASPSLRAWGAAQGLRRITALHVWRIPAALAFFWYGAQGALPETFVRHAAWGDLLAGILALIVVTALPRSRGAYWTFHVIGMVDFLLAVGTGLAFSLMAVPEMSQIAVLPLAIIPLIGVPLSAATHVAAFDLMRRGARP